MTGLRFVCLGVGDAFSASWYSSSLLLECEQTRLLVDCPHPIRKILREAGQAAGLALDLPQVSALVLTHLHADHSSGLEGFGFFHHFVLRRPGVVLAHPDVTKDLWNRHLAVTMEASLDPSGAAAAPMTLADYFDLRPLNDQAAASFGPFEIECRRTIHPIPTFALRISAGGRRLGLSSDTSFDPGLIDWLASSDLVVHEANLGLHTPYEKLAALPASIRAKLKLIHYPDDFDLQASVIEPLVPGRSYEV
jgi:ribonuclease BN (tRNA processing enzyme)